MPKICNNCKKESFNNYICDYCKIPIENKSNWVQNHKIEEYEDFRREENISIKKDTLAIVAVIVIAIGIIYIAYTKYEERRQIEEVTIQMNALFGSTIKMANEAQRSISQNFSSLNNNIKYNNQNIVLKSKIRKLENEIRNYKINKYYDHKNQILKRKKAISNMKEQLRIK